MKIYMLFSGRFSMARLVEVLLVVMVASTVRADVVVSDPHGNGSYLGLPVLQPGSTNAFRVVLYNHGGLGFLVGGDLEKVVRKLAEEGFIAYAKKRSGILVTDTLIEVQEGLDDLLDLTPGMLQGRAMASSTNGPGISLMGYSRGGLMTIRVAELQATTNKPYVKIDRVIMQASAPGEKVSNPGTTGQWINGGATTFSNATTMDLYLANGSIGSTDNLGLIDASSTAFFMTVAENDQPPDNTHNNLVDLMTTAHQRLLNRVDSEGDPFPVASTLKVYDSWNSPQTGHNLFGHVDNGGQELLNQEGYYWYDVIRFLNHQSIDTNHTGLLPNPTPLLVIETVEVTSNMFCFSFQSVSGATYTVEASGDLVGWMPVATSAIPVLVEATTDVSWVWIDLPTNSVSRYFIRVGTTSL